MVVGEIWHLGQANKHTFPPLANLYLAQTNKQAQMHRLGLPTTAQARLERASHPSIGNK